MNIKKLPSIALFSLAIIACGEKSEDNMHFGTVTADKVVTLSNDEGSPQCSVHLQIVYATEENGHKAEVVNELIERHFLNMEDVDIKYVADSFANAYTKAYLRNLLPLYNKDRADSTKRMWYEYHFVITSEAQQGCSATDIRPATSVVSAIIDYFEGGTRSVNQQTTLNFNNRTGQLLGFSDIFVPGYESRLAKVLQKALCEKVGADGLAALHKMGYLVGMDMFPAENFILNDDTITFIYNPDEIASADKGTTELIISLNALKPILKPEFTP